MIPTTRKRSMGLRFCFALLVPLASIAMAKLPPTSPTEPAPPVQAEKLEVLELPRQTLVMKPTREDFTVGCVMFSLRSSDMSKPLRREAIRVNGAKLEAEVLYLKQVGKNQFELPAMKIEFSPQELGGPLILTLKPWFNEVTNQYDSLFYDHVPDRYAQLSYCTQEDFDTSGLNARLGANRVVTKQEFLDRLSKPLVIALNQRALKEEWGRYPMLPPGDRLSAAELKAVEQAVRDKGEKFPIVISVVDADHARVTVGKADFFQPARTYVVARGGEKWAVESVKDVKAE